MDNLPDTILGHIFSHVDYLELCRCSQVCKRWRILIMQLDEILWRVLYRKHGFSELANLEFSQLYATPLEDARRLSLSDLLVAVRNIPSHPNYRMPRKSLLSKKDLEDQENDDDDDNDDDEKEDAGLDSPARRAKHRARSRRKRSKRSGSSHRSRGRGNSPSSLLSTHSQDALLVDMGDVTDACAEQNVKVHREEPIRVSRRKKRSADGVRHRDASRSGSRDRKSHSLRIGSNELSMIERVKGTNRNRLDRPRAHSAQNSPRSSPRKSRKDLETSSGADILLTEDGTANEDDDADSPTVTSKSKSKHKRRGTKSNTTSPNITRENSSEATNQPLVHTTHSDQIVSARGPGDRRSERRKRNAAARMSDHPPGTLERSASAEDVMSPDKRRGAKTAKKKIVSAENSARRQEDESTSKEDGRRNPTERAASPIPTSLQGRASRAATAGATSVGRAAAALLGKMEEGEEWKGKGDLARVYPIPDLSGIRSRCAVADQARWKSMFADRFLAAKRLDPMPMHEGMPSAGSDKDPLCVRVGIYGSGYSGKSVLYHQMERFYMGRKGVRKDLILRYRWQVQAACLEGMQQLLRYIHEHALSPELLPLVEHRDAARRVRQLDTMDDRELDWRVALDMQVLWALPAVRHLVATQGFKIGLTPDVAYFFGEIARISQSLYCPTWEDILRSYIPTSSVRTAILPVHKGVQYLVMQSGGSQSQQRKLYSTCFDLSMIYYVVDTSSYDITDLGTRNSRLVESLRQFRTLCSNRWLNNVAMVLVFNKFDLFAAKLRVRPLSDHLRGAPDTLPEAMKFISSLYEEIASFSPNVRLFHVQWTSLLHDDCTFKFFKKIHKLLARSKSHHHKQKDK